MRSSVFICVPLWPILVFAQPTHRPNYDDDVRPLFARRCFTCHSASEMRSGLNLESYAGVMKGGGSGDAVIPGRPASSMLLKVVNRDEGVPQMPLGQPKLPDAEIALIRDWIQFGLLENAASVPKGGAGPSADYIPSSLNKPEGAPAMPENLPPVEVKDPARPHPVTALAASPWAPLAAIAGHEKIYLYDLAKRAPAGELAFPEGVPFVLRFSRNGDLLLAAGGKAVQSGKAVLFDVRTGNRVAVVGQERDDVLAADITPDGKLIALGGPGRLVRVYHAAGGTLAYEIKKHTDWITALEFSPDGTRLATGDRGGSISLWEAASGGTVGALAEHKDAITSLSWRGDSQLLASASEDGNLIVWNVGDGFPLSTISKQHTLKPAPGHYGVIPGGVLCAQFTGDGRIVSVGRDSVIRIWGADGKPRGRVSPANDALLTKVAASFDGNLFLAGDYQGKVILWDGGKPSILRGAPLPTVSERQSPVIPRLP
jgi:cytochrome c/WD40 domain-containing protein